MKASLLAMLLTLGIGSSAGAEDRPKPASAPTSEARAFAHDDGIVDLLIIGPAAKVLYERLPGPGTQSACGASGLHRGDGRIRCVEDAGAYSCHIWLDAAKQTLTKPETDDC